MSLSQPHDEIVEEIRKKLPLPDNDPDNNESHHARRDFTEMVASHIREVLKAVPTEEMRADIIFQAGFCVRCGADFTNMVQIRHWYRCDCIDGEE